jgi:hypothetical protein
VLTAPGAKRLRALAQALLAPRSPPIIIALDTAGKVTWVHGPPGLDFRDELYSTQYYWETANPPPDPD